LGRSDNPWTTGRHFHAKKQLKKKLSPEGQRGTFEKKRKK